MTGSKGKTYRKYDKTEAHSDSLKKSTHHKHKERKRKSQNAPQVSGQKLNRKEKRKEKEKSFQEHSASMALAASATLSAPAKRSAATKHSASMARAASATRSAPAKRSAATKRSASMDRPAPKTSSVKRKLPKRTAKSPAQIMRKERRKKRRMAERYVHFIAVFSVAFLVAIAVLSIYLFGYLKAMLEYKELNKQFVTLKGSNIQAAPDQEVKGVPDLKVNFKGLSSINADVASWIYMPGVDISYPVVRGKDNDYYLQHTFEKNVSLSGAIFMDYQDSPDLVGFNTFIYGHNMRNGTMFGSLKKYLQDETLIQSAPYFYLYLKDGSVKKYRIFAYYQDDGNSDTYSRPSKEGEEAYLAMIRKKSFVRVTLTPEEEKQAALFHEYVTLSTCTGFTGSGRRFLVHGVCVDTE